MPNDSNRPDVAVFIDFENVYVSVRDKLDANPNFEMIMDRCEDFGRVVIARAYADWYRYPRVTSALYANGIEPMYVPTYYYDRELGRTGRAIKNSVDMNLCIDAMRTLYTNTNIAKFVLATGDRDFIPLVNTIRQQGKEVIIIGIGGAASAHLAQSADEFIFYESLVGKKPTDLQADLPRAKMPEKGREYEGAEEEAPPATAPRGRDRDRDREAQREQEPQRAEASTQTDIYDTLVSAINLARERGYVCSFGSLKLLMKELMGGDFKEGKYKDANGRPFAKFKDFVLEAERRGKVQVFTRGTVNEVFLPGEDPYKLSQFAQEIKEEPGMPVIPAAEVDIRPESRSSVIANGRRRRRRSRGGQRQGAPALENGVPVDEQGDEIEELDLPELVLPELTFDDQGDELFDTLAELAAEPEQAPEGELPEPAGELVQDEARDQAELIASATQPEQAAGEPNGDAEDASAQTDELPFDDTDWQLLRTTLERFERPVSFAQIHDALRNARNAASTNRTNEELRTLIKQAINTGLLARIGKGNRASYRLAETDGLAEQPQNVGIHVEPTQAKAPAEQLQDMAAVPVEPAQGEALAGQPVTQETGAPDRLATIEASAAPTSAPAKRSRSRRKPAPEATAEPAADATLVSESAPAAASAPAKQPARSSRKKAAPAETPAVEAPAKPQRSRRRKAESAE